MSSVEAPSTALVRKHNPVVFPEYKDTSLETLATDFKSSNGQVYIDAWRRVDSEGQLDLYATATAAGVLVYRGLKHGDKANAYLVLRREHLIPRFEAQIMLGISPQQERFLLGHELGHLAIRDYLTRISPASKAKFEWGQKEKRRRDQLEALCDYFAMRLLGFDGSLDSFDWEGFPDLRLTE